VQFLDGACRVQARAGPANAADLQPGRDACPETNESDASRERVQRRAAKERKLRATGEANVVGEIPNRKVSRQKNEGRNISAPICLTEETSLARPASPQAFFSGSLNTHFKEQFRRGGQAANVAYSNVLSRKKQGDGELRIRNTELKTDLARGFNVQGWFDLL
jgi:hypothetical protein